MTERIVKFVGVDGDGDDEDQGAVIFDDETGEFTTLVGPDGNEEMFRSIMASPVFVQTDEGTVDVTAEDDPRTFFEGLPKMYRSHTGMALPPRELTHEDLEGYEYGED